MIYSEISGFVSINERTANDIIVWEAFKAYIRQVSISQRKFKERECQRFTEQLRKKRELRENELEEFKNQLKLMEMNDIAKDTMVSSERV